MIGWLPLLYLKKFGFLGCISVVTLKLYFSLIDLLEDLSFGLKCLVVDEASLEFLLVAVVHLVGLDLFLGGVVTVTVCFVILSLEYF